MKRDFQEEYQNYIESDMPDLWSRIEPNLKEKGVNPEREESGAEKEDSEGSTGEIQGTGKEPERNKGTRVIYLLKRAVPVAACLCVLVIGIGVMRVSKSSFDMTNMESASEPQEDAGLLYGMESAEVTEEAAGEPEAAGEEAAAADESFDTAEDMEDAMDESAAPAEAPAKTGQAEETAGIYEDDVEGTQTNGVTESGEAVTVEVAVLSKIAVASEEMQEEGYAYAYTFRLEDDSRLIVYLTNDQCRELEENGVEIKRQSAYTLSVFPLNAGQSMMQTDVGEGILENLQKLP